MLTAAILLLGVVLDKVFGEPARYHPLVGFGNLANALEKRLNRYSGFKAQLAGTAALTLLVLPPTIVMAMLWYVLLHHSPLAALIIGAGVLYWSLGWRSLADHVNAVGTALNEQGIEAGRAAVQRIVSRECDTMDENQVVRASLETLLENTSDAVIGPLVWFVLLGPAGALMYRLSNTLDAMWGYRTPRFNHFGRAAARCDDLVNIIPARLTALAFALTGNTRSSLRCWKQYANHWSSPNGGPVICAGSGALNVSLGGGAVYHGQWLDKPATPGNPATSADVKRALKLVTRATLLIVGALMTCSLVLAAYGLLP